MVHPADERAVRLTRAMLRADLDTLIPLLPGTWARPTVAVHALLAPIFTAAQQGGVSLLRPPPDFHAWLTHAARLPGITHTPVTSNTVRTRLSVLSTLYDALIDEGLLLAHPLRGLKRPPAEPTTRPLPSQDEITQLLTLAREDLALHTALTLVYHHALQVPELLSLTWGAYEPRDGTLLRRRTITRLEGAAHTAVTRLHAKAGGVFAPEHKRLFPYTDHDTLRKRIFRLTWGKLRFISLGDLRRASLRDFPHTAASAGFAAEGGERNLERAVSLAHQAMTRSMTHEKEPET
jgi:hypothetical protein